IGRWARETVDRIDKARREARRPSDTQRTIHHAVAFILPCNQQGEACRTNLQIDKVCRIYASRDEGRRFRAAVAVLREARRGRISGRLWPSRLAWWRAVCR